MYISEEEAKNRLEKSDLIIKEKVRKKSGYVRGHLGDGVRELAGTLAHFDTQRNVAESLGITQATVSESKNGLVANHFDKDLKDKIDKNVKARKEDLADTLLTNLSAALAEVGSKIKSTDAVEASKIAKDMSQILDKVTGESKEKSNQTAIIINVPVQRDEKFYKTIEV